MLSFVHQIMVFAGGYAHRIRLAWVTSFLKAMFQNAPLMAAVVLINALVGGRTDVGTVWATAGVLVVLLVAQSACQYATDRLQSAAGYEMFAEKRLGLAGHLRRLPMGYFTAGNLGKISSVLSGDMVFAEEHAMRVMASITSDLFSQVVIIAFLFVLHPLIGAAALVTALVAGMLAHWMHRESTANSVLRQEAVEVLTGAVVEHIEGLAVNKTFNRSGAAASGLRDAFSQMTRMSLRFEHEHAPWERCLLIIYGIGMTGVIALAVHLLSSGALDLGVFVGVVLCSFILFKPLEGLFSQDAVVTIMKAALDRINAVFAEVEIDDSGQALVDEDARHEVEFRDVSFSYAQADGEVLRGVSFTADRGQMIALVGMSGSGKTTLANLLARFWDVSSGQVLVHGVDIRRMPLSELMNRVSMVFQHAYVFEGSIFDNIAFGAAGVSDEAVREAARQAQCLDFIEALPYGFDTHISPGGTTLSGGEVQRLSIARCILKDAPIVILDEATANIDADNEVAIQKAMSQVCRDKTTIVIAHKLHTVQNADLILVLDHGEIVQRGTHQELMASCGVYAAMVQVSRDGTLWSNTTVSDEAIHA